jgi:hypothetical protein
LNDLKSTATLPHYTVSKDMRELSQIVSKDVEGTVVTQFKQLYGYIPLCKLTDNKKAQETSNKVLPE